MVDLIDYQRQSAATKGRAALSKAATLLRETGRKEGTEPDIEAQMIARELAAEVIDEAQRKADALALDGEV